jgi:UDP-N-acetylmuramoyl-tripeptide--D-alanyl-D-alanine ligase
VGEEAAGVVDRLVVVGDGARGIANCALGAGLDPAHVAIAADREDALATLLAELREGDTVLLKASRGAALDVLVEQLLLAAGTGDARV